MMGRSKVQCNCGRWFKSRRGLMIHIWRWNKGHLLMKVG